MQAVLGGQRVGLDLEFLQSVGEWERHVHGVEGVVIERAIQEVSDAGEQPAADGDVQTSREACRSRLSRRHRGSGKLDELDGIPPVERQLENALILNYHADAGALRIHERGIGFHLHGLGHRADLQRHVDGGIGGHLQHDARLHIGREPLLGHFQAVRPDRQIGQDVVAVGAAGDAANRTGIGLGCFHVGIGDRAAGRVRHRPLNLRSGLRPQGRAAGHQDKHNQHSFHAKSPFSK